MSGTPLPPNATLGVIGGGQLARMFALAAARLGYKVHVFAPESEPPAARVCAQHTQAAYEDASAVDGFLSGVDAVTYEFENIPFAMLEHIQAVKPLYPGADLLRWTRNRLREKDFLAAHEIPVTRYATVRSLAECAAAVPGLGPDIIFKTTELGYDGKGQCRWREGESLDTVWDALGHPTEAIAEAVVDLALEFSILVARDAAGTEVCCGPFVNTHTNHILDYTVWQADLSTDWAETGRAIAGRLAAACGLQGMICIEFFVSRAGDVLVNEIAPRPHNSGHLTIEACSISQFEQQARLTAGYPAVAPIARAPAAAMANLLGDLWTPTPPDWKAIAADPAVSLHLYGKGEARPGRKMGHLTALGDSAEEALDRVLTARARLQR